VDNTLVALLIRGDRTLNTVKAEKLPQVAQPFTFATVDRMKAVIGCNPGSIGPVGLNIPIIADEEVLSIADFSCGANTDDKHYVYVNWKRDLPEAETADLRQVVAGDPSPDGKGVLQLARGIEVGHIFQLGDKYSRAMGATVLNASGKPIPLQMGCYGIGISRIVAAAIEQNHDKNGIIWPTPITPFSVILIPLNAHKNDRVRKAAEKLYQNLTRANFEVLFEDRKERPGVLFANADLIGIPHRIVITEEKLDAGVVEYKARCDAHTETITLSALVTFLSKKEIGLTHSNE